MRARLIVRDPDADVFELTDDRGDQLAYDLGTEGSRPDGWADDAKTRRVRFDELLFQVTQEIGSLIYCLHAGAEIRGTVLGYDQSVMVIHVVLPRPHNGGNLLWIDLAGTEIP